MLIPKHWVAVRLQSGKGRRSIVVERWGWANSSEEDARVMAEQRARAALDARLAGGHEAAREPKVPYSSPDGLPIREEVLREEVGCVVTRNSYGAQCLNVPDVLIADVDYAADHPKLRSNVLALLQLGCVLVGCLLLGALGLPLWVVVAIGALGLVGLHLTRKPKATMDPDESYRSRVSQFLSTHPAWRLRVYQTPAGLRLIAEHARFEPTSPETQEFFDQVGADPDYARLCRIQQCFRARLTPKPWRIGMRERLRPRPGVWPLDSDEKRASRAAWVARYEAASKGYAACRYLETLGSFVTDADAQKVVKLHDRLCGAESSLPIA